MTQTAIDPFARIHRRLKREHFLSYRLDENGDVRAYRHTKKLQDYDPAAHTLLADIEYISEVEEKDMTRQARDDIRILDYALGPLNQEFRFTRQANGFYLIEHFGLDLRVDPLRYGFRRTAYSSPELAMGLAAAHRLLIERLDRKSNIARLALKSDLRQRRVA